MDERQQKRCEIMEKKSSLFGNGIEWLLGIYRL